jgi:hypothetical protein
MYKLFHDIYYDWRENDILLSAALQINVILSLPSLGKPEVMSLYLSWLDLVARLDIRSSAFADFDFVRQTIERVAARISTVEVIDIAEVRPKVKDREYLTIALRFEHTFIPIREGRKLHLDDIRVLRFAPGSGDTLEFVHFLTSALLSAMTDTFTKGLF